MIRIGIIISFLIFSCEVTLSLYAQGGDSLENYITVDMLPTFRGSSNYTEFGKYIASELIYPDEAIRDSFQGRVIVYFIVDSTGSVTNPRPKDTVPTYIKEEIERVFLNSPKWAPGKHEGKDVNVFFGYPVTFSMNTTNKDEVTKNQQYNRCGKRNEKKEKTTANN